MKRIKFKFIDDKFNIVVGIIYLTIMEAIERERCDNSREKREMCNCGCVLFLLRIKLSIAKWVRVCYKVVMAFCN